MSVNKSTGVSLNPETKPFKPRNAGCTDGGARTRQKRRVPATPRRVGPKNRDEALAKAQRDGVPKEIIPSLVAVWTHLKTIDDRSAMSAWSRLYGRLAFYGRDIQLSGDGYCVAKALRRCGYEWADAPAVVDRGALVSLAMTTGCEVTLSQYHTHEILGVISCPDPLGSIVLYVDKAMTHCYDADIIGYAPPSPGRGPRVHCLSDAITVALPPVGEVALAAGDKKKKPKKKKQPTEEQKIRAARSRTDQALRNVRNQANKFEPESKDETNAWYQHEKGVLKGMRTDHPKFKAQNFRANNFQAAALPSDVLSEMTGRANLSPCSTTHDAIDSLLNTIEKNAEPPLRFGDGSVMMKVTSNIVKSMAALPAGDLVYVMTPLRKAYLGAVIFTMAPTGVTWSTLGYVAPEKDLEKLSTHLATSCATLHVNSQIVVGGSTVNVARVTAESAICTSCGLKALPGKLSVIARNRSAPPLLVGEEGVSLWGSTALMEPDQVICVSTFDPEDTNIVRVPNGDAQQDYGMMVPTSTRKVRFSAYEPTASANATRAFGFAAGFATGGVTAVTANATSLWKLSDTNIYLNHMWFGDFTMAAQFYSHTPVSASTGHKFILTVTYSDASTNTREFYFDEVSGQDDGIRNFLFSTYGNELFQSKTGLIISDIDISVRKMEGAGSPATVQISSPYVDIEFHSIAFDTEYMVHMLSGVSPQSNLTVALSAWAEVFPTATSDIGKYIPLSTNGPYTTGHYPDAVRLLMGANTAWTKGPYAAAWYSPLSKLANFSRGVGNVIGHVMMANPETALAGHALATITNPELYKAKGFGNAEDPRGSRSSTNVFFPAVRGEDLAIFAIRPGVRPEGPSWVNALTSVSLGAAGNWEGESADLAFLVAALQTEGWPIAAGPRSGLLLSGDIENVVPIFTQDRLTGVTFDLLPVAETKHKDAVAGYTKFLVGDIVLVNGKSLPPGSCPLSMLFGRSVQVASQYHAVGDGSKNPDHCWWEVELSLVR